jgi:hypothetical protein
MSAFLVRFSQFLPQKHLPVWGLVGSGFVLIDPRFGQKSSIRAGPK